MLCSLGEHEARQLQDLRKQHRDTCPICCVLLLYLYCERYSTLYTESLLWILEQAPLSFQKPQPCLVPQASISTLSFTHALVLIFFLLSYKTLYDQILTLAIENGQASCMLPRSLELPLIFTTVGGPETSKYLSPFHTRSMHTAQSECIHLCYYW